MSRRYFRTSFGAKGDGKGKGKHKGGTCLRCGSQDHSTSNCPRSAGSNSAAATGHDQAAPFVCFAEDDVTEDAYGNLSEEHPIESGCTTHPPTTLEAVYQGKAVLDGGATRTIGSVKALERIMELNYQNNGEGLNLEDKPTFGFGNSTRNQCVSTAAFRIQADGREGQLQVHALDSGEGPVLFSISSLRALGAVVDFSEDLVCFRNLNPKKIIKLERSSTGHQLLPLTEDWYSGAPETTSSVPSLKEFI